MMGQVYTMSVDYCNVEYNSYLVYATGAALRGP